MQPITIGKIGNEKMKKGKITIIMTMGQFQQQ